MIPSRPGEPDSAGFSMRGKKMQSLKEPNKSRSKSILTGHCETFSSSPGSVIYGDSSILFSLVKLNGVQAGEMARWEEPLLPSPTT